MNTKPVKTEFIKPELTVEELSIALYNVNQKLAQTNVELLQSQKELAEIFENISHDLRSPITAIRNSIEYLLSLNSLDPKEVLQTIKLMYRRVDYLDQLISDVFLLSSIDSSKKVLQFQTINIGIFLEDFFFTCEADRKYAKRRLCLNVPEDFPYMVSIDGRMLLRVLDNLFSNALKYSDDEATITLSAAFIEDNTIHLSVADTGYGIAKEHLAKIFDRTYMVSSARTPGQFSGCGLGLAIAKTVIENHGGIIWCESELGKGSIFKFTLPVVI
jgi:signal transduction histidine kinase